MKFCSLLFAGLFATIVFVASARYSAAHSSDPDAAIGEFLSIYCIDCHGAATPAVGLDLTRHWRQRPEDGGHSRQPFQG